MDTRASLQEREVHRYYQPWLSAQGSSLNVASHIEGIAQGELSSQGYQPRAAPDKALLAFAQLAVSRLNVRRAMVSLIDTTSQMILAEATRNLSLTASDELWLGTAILPKNTAICHHCSTNECTARNDNGNTLTCSGLIVDDCRLDGRFADRPYVVQDPRVCFYAGVPIVSRAGYFIGAYAVSDENPRDGLRVEELKFMQETATAVMEHLEWARDRVDRFKGERVVRGMASFIEGCSSMDRRDDSKAADHDPTPSPPPKDGGSPTARPQVTARNSYRRQAMSAHWRSLEPEAAKVLKKDRISLVYTRAAEILRESTLADGVIILGTAPGSDMRVPTHNRTPSGTPGTPPIPLAPSPGSDSFSHDTSDSEASPLARPCTLLAVSVANEEVDISLTLGTLERYFQLHPRGKKFYFTGEGSDFTSGDDATDTGHSPDVRKVRKSRRLDHRELLEKLARPLNVIFLPLYDYAEEKLVAGCFLWSTSVGGRMMGLDDELSYLRAFGNSIMSEVARIRTQQNEAAKTTFISQISHELRSPLHGILGAAELLKDSAQDSFQSGLLISISTCGKTLLDTLNHVLDYSKINKLGRNQMRRFAKNKTMGSSSSDSALESMSISAEVDLGVLVEEVAETITAGHSFQRVYLPSTSMSVSASSEAPPSIDLQQDGQLISALDTSLAVSVLLDISPRQSWLVRTQPGALRRIIMNLLGNSLKYTTNGFVAVSLRAQDSSQDGKMDTLIRVVDSGKGMSEDFLREKLFVPFSQEDPYQAGTGLGLSIVKQIVDSLGGSIEVKSQQNMGTAIDIRVSLTQSHAQAVTTPHDDLLSIASQTKGMNVVILDPFSATEDGALSGRIGRLEETLRVVCTSWFEMEVSRSAAMDCGFADFYIFAEPPPLERLISKHQRRGQSPQPHHDIPVIIVCLNAEEAVHVDQHQRPALSKLGCHVEIISQPCGPRKLAKVLQYCLQKRKESPADRFDAEVPHVSTNSGTEPRQRNQEQAADSTSAHPPADPESISSKPQSPRRKSLSDSLSAAVSFPSPMPLAPTTPALLSDGPVAQTTIAESAPHILLVDDNKINLQLLVMFMKKLKFSYIEAVNGQEAVDAFKDACLPGPHSRGPGKRFDAVLMDISMPVMNGMVATTCIREFEKENGLERTTVIALTGLASAQAQADAIASGIDIYLSKPVRFAALKKLLVVAD